MTAPYQPPMIKYTIFFRTAGVVRIVTSRPLDLDSGSIMWTACNSFLGSLMGEEAIRYLLGISLTTLDRFNDRFMLLKMGAMDLDTFCQTVRQ